MSNLGPVYEDDEHYSPSRNNAKGILRDTGSNIVAIATTKQIGLAMPTDTSGGLIKNVLYYADYDSNFNRIQFLPVFHRHLHGSEDSQEDGGSYINIRHRNIETFAEAGITNIVKDPQSLYDFNSLNATLTYFESGNDALHRIDTLSVAGNYGNCDFSGIQFEWNNTMQLQFQLGLDENANILARMGTGTDRVNETPSTSRRQMAIEACDGHGTNWVMLNANGNSGSLVVTATTIALITGKRTIKLEHDPATTCKIYNNAILNATSITNVADDGRTDMRRLFRWGVKLPAGTDNINLDLFYLKILGDHGANN